MDVTLVLTHRCNLSCNYCYAGEHYRRDMETATIERAVELLVADGAPVAQLGFFGGEPFLAFEGMQRAVARAAVRCRERGTRLLLQCTTNGSLIDDEKVAFIRDTGMKVTVSIDGIREAHDLQRPRAGGGSSFDQVAGGLRKLLAAGVDPDAMMVISPQTVPHVYASVSWLWSLGVKTVRSNLVLDAPWYGSDRDELRDQLESVALELLGRRMRGEPAMFEPFAIGMRGAAPACGARPSKRAQVAVATGGNLYPCAPMVGEDRDGGREATMRIGMLSNDPSAIAARVAKEGAGCGDGKQCACAAFLETGNPATGGPNGLWFARVCREMGEAVAKGLAQAAPRRTVARRPLLLGVAAMLTAAGGGAVAAILGAGSSGLGFRTAGEQVQVSPPGAVNLPAPEPIPPRVYGPPTPEPSPPVPGQMLEPPPPPRPEGEIGPPPAPDATKVDGYFM